MIRVCPLSELPRGEALRVEAEPPIAVFHTDEGERGDVPVAVLGMNQARLFGRWRRQLNATPVPA
jgi:hypothetical protein